MTDSSNSHTRVLVVGASGRTGLHVVEQARRRGLQVTALVRDAERFEPAGDDLTVIEGDVCDPDAVGRAMHGQGAVICVLGPARGDPVDTCSRGTRCLIDAMRRHHVRRLVVVTGAMIGHPRQFLVGLVYRALRWLLPPGQRALLADRREQERLVQQSDLDWTLVRPTRLSDEPAGHRPRAASDLIVGSFAHVGRADLAAYLLDALGRDELFDRGVALAY